ncbi:MAG: hypothetical protein ACTSPD_11815 [Promethearchaeota archaeon]
MTHYVIINGIKKIIEFNLAKEKKSRKKSVHTTISDESYDIIQQFQSEFGSKSAVVDAALKLFKKSREPYLEDKKKIWCRARDELNMLLVGKTTFLSYIKGEKEEVYTNNIAVEAIEWYLGKRKEQMDLKEFLNGLKGMWEVANYFYRIDLEQNEYGTFQMTFKHDLNKEYSTFWAYYFKKLLYDNWKCFIEPFIRNESFYLIIKEE